MRSTKYDDIFDHLFPQTPFMQSERLKRSRIVHTAGILISFASLAFIVGLATLH
jgi:hypothetical protein